MTTKATKPHQHSFWDARVDLFRAQAHFYRESLDYLKRERRTFKNTAPRYHTLSLSQQSPPDQRPHQSESITA